MCFDLLSFISSKEKKTLWQEKWWNFCCLHIMVYSIYRLAKCHSNDKLLHEFETFADRICNK